jgi:predicted ATP-dependent serine protease
MGSNMVERSEKAARIIAQPKQFKICESCESLVARRVALCPNCNGYRFDEAPESVAEQAKLLASKVQSTVPARKKSKSEIMPAHDDRQNS